VRTLVETALLCIAGVGAAEAGAFLEVLRVIMPFLSDETLGFFAQRGQRLALVVGKGEHEGESAMAGCGGATAQAMLFVQVACREAGVRLGIVDVDPFYAASRIFLASGRVTDASSVGAQRLAETLVGVLLAAARAGDNTVVLFSTMLGGGARGSWTFDFPLLREEADRALNGCRGAVQDKLGRWLVEGGPHWSVCWARAGAGAELLRCLREVALARHAGASDATKAQAKGAKKLLLRMAAAGCAAAEASDLRFAPLTAIALSEEPAELVARGTDKGDEEAAELITDEATAHMLENMPGAAELVTTLKHALNACAVRAGTVSRPGPPIGGFETELIILPDFGSFKSSLQVDVAPGGGRGVPFPSSMSVIAADLVQGMNDNGEIFSLVEEYSVYSVVIRVRNRAVRAYAGSAGQTGLGFIDAYKARTATRNSVIVNHGGVGDSNLGIFIAKLRGEVEAGTLVEASVVITVNLLGFRVPEGKLSEALGGAHALGLFAEQMAIIALWPYTACLNGNHVALKIDTGFDSASGAAAGES